MQNFVFKKAAAGHILRFKLFDGSITSEPRGLTGLGFETTDLLISTIGDNEAVATFYTGLNIEAVSVIGTYAAPTSGKCRFAEVDPVRHPGLYELHLGTARFNVNSGITISISGAVNLIQEEIYVKLQADDPDVAKPTNFNLASIDASGRVDVGKFGGTTVTARDIGASVLLSSGTGSGQIDLTSGSVNITQAAANKAWTGVGVGGATKALTDVTNIVSNGAITTLGGAVVNVDTVDTVTAIGEVTTVGTVTNPVELSATANSAALVTSILSGIETSLILNSILEDTNEIQEILTDGGTMPMLLADIYAAIDTEVAAIKAKTDQMAFTSGKIDAGIQNVGDITAAVCNKIADHLLRRSAAVAIASANGDTKSYKSLLGAIAKLTNRVDISGGTMTTYEPNGTTILGTQIVTSSPSADPITGLGN